MDLPNDCDLDLKPRGFALLGSSSQQWRRRQTVVPTPKPRRVKGTMGGNTIYARVCEKGKECDWDSRSLSLPLICEPAAAGVLSCFSQIHSKAVL